MYETEAEELQLDAEESEEDMRRAIEHQNDLYAQQIEVEELHLGDDGVKHRAETVGLFGGHCDVCGEEGTITLCLGCNEWLCGECADGHECEGEGDA